MKGLLGICRSYAGTNFSAFNDRDMFSSMGPASVRCVKKVIRHLTRGASNAKLDIDMPSETEKLTADNSPIAADCGTGFRTRFAPAKRKHLIYVVQELKANDRSFRQM